MANIEILTRQTIGKGLVVNPITGLVDVKISNNIDNKLKLNENNELEVILPEAETGEGRVYDWNPTNGEEVNLDWVTFPNKTMVDGKQVSVVSPNAIATPLLFNDVGEGEESVVVTPITVEELNNESLRPISSDRGVFADPNYVNEDGQIINGAKIAYSKTLASGSVGMGFVTTIEDGLQLIVKGTGGVRNMDITYFQSDNLPIDNSGNPIQMDALFDELMPIVSDIPAGVLSVGLPSGGVECKSSIFVNGAAYVDAVISTVDTNWNSSDEFWTKLSLIIGRSPITGGLAVYGSEDFEVGTASHFDPTKPITAIVTFYLEDIPGDEPQDVDGVIFYTPLYSSHVLSFPKVGSGSFKVTKGMESLGISDSIMSKIAYNPKKDTTTILDNKESVLINDTEVASAISYSLLHLKQTGGQLDITGYDRLWDDNNEITFTVNQEGLYAGGVKLLNNSEAKPLSISQTSLDALIYGRDYIMMNGLFNQAPFPELDWTYLELINAELPEGWKVGDYLRVTHEGLYGGVSIKPGDILHVINDQAECIIYPHIPYDPNAKLETANNKVVSAKSITDYVKQQISKPLKTDKSLITTNGELGVNIASREGETSLLRKLEDGGLWVDIPTGYDQLFIDRIYTNKITPQYADLIGYGNVSHTLPSDIDTFLLRLESNITLILPEPQDSTYLHYTTIIVYDPDTMSSKSLTIQAPKAIQWSEGILPVIPPGGSIIITLISMTLRGYSNPPNRRYFGTFNTFYSSTG